MPMRGTRRQFLFQSLDVIGGTMVAGDLLPLLAEAAKRKQVLRVAIERDFETLRPELSAGDTVNMLRRLIYTTPILWGTKQRPDGSLIYDADSIETVLATAYKVSEDRQLIEFTLRNNAKFANGDPINAQALKESYPGFWVPVAPDSSRSTACPAPIASRWLMR
jgi:ABC-type transport system substrate-binding protein